MKVLIDSDVLIEVSRGRNHEILAKWTGLGDSGVTIIYTPVTEAELWAGAGTIEYDALNELFRALLCAPIDCEVGRQAGEYLREYRNSHGLQLGDALIAAAALSHGARLWTRNRKHYPMKDLVLY